MPARNPRDSKRLRRESHARSIVKTFEKNVHSYTNVIPLYSLKAVRGGDILITDSKDRKFSRYKWRIVKCKIFVVKQNTHSSIMPKLAQ